MFNATAISKIEKKKENQDLVCDDAKQIGNADPNKKINIKEYKSNLENILHYSMGVEELLESQIGKLCKQEQSNIFCCHFCNSKFESKSNLKKHLLNHAVMKSTTCDICNSRILQYSRKDIFNICKTCNVIKSNLITRLDKDKSCVQNEKFQRRLKKHFFCEVCDYKCTRNSSLKVHGRIHSGVKPFSCKICDYKCTDKRNLQRHLRIHTGEKPYFCTICDYKCADKSSLRIHLRIHTGEKPFVCEYCDYKSIDKRNLRRHLAIHTGDKPHSCEICNYKTVNKRNLRRHFKVHT